ncbi:MAG: hypothetical protein V1712_03220 [Patescibacteria group bacterium]
MPKYIITTSINEEIEGEDEDDAKNNFFEMIENTPQETITTYLFDRLITTKTKSL